MTQQTRRLYFTADEICIGPYDEVHQYEQRTSSSYCGSDFFELPPNYNPVNKSLAEIRAAIQTHRRQRLFAKYAKS